MDRAEKREFVTELNAVFNEAGSVIVAHYTGLTVAQMGDLRSKMRDAGGTVKVAKNRLAKIALKGTEAEGMSDLFTGQTVIAYASDPVTAPKIAAEFAKSNDKLVLLGGALGLAGVGERHGVFAERAREAGVYVSIEEFDDMQHVFHFLAGNAPEADDAIRKMAEWLRPRLAIS